MVNYIHYCKISNHHFIHFSTILARPTLSCHCLQHHWDTWPCETESAPQRAPYPWPPTSDPHQSLFIFCLSIGYISDSCGEYIQVQSGHSTFQRWLIHLGECLHRSCQSRCQNIVYKAPITFHDTLYLDIHQPGGSGIHSFGHRV